MHIVSVHKICGNKTEFHDEQKNNSDPCKEYICLCARNTVNNGSDEQIKRANTLLHINYYVIKA
jgi:hypothetical protein